MHRFILFLLVISSTVQAQKAVVSERDWVMSVLSDQDALDTLVEKALTNSYWLKSYEGELAQQYENVKQEKNKWLSTFRFGINFFSINTTVNEQNQSVTTAGLFPTVGLNLTVDPEKFINRGSYVREAQYNVTRAENQLLHQRKQIRTEITRLFYQYLEALGIQELREAANQTQKEQCVLVEERFKKGEETMETVLLNQNALLLTEEAVLKSKIAAQKWRAEINLFIEATEGRSVKTKR